MGTQEIIELALQLNAAERFELVERIRQSLDLTDKPDAAIDRAWTEEAESRLLAYRRGEMIGIPAGDVVGEL